MRYEMLFGVAITDQSMYAAYRTGIRPLLAMVGGAFRWDMEVSGVLKSEVQGDFNRVFVISFPDRSARDGFFENPQYLALRARLLIPAVEKITVIAEYERQPQEGVQ